MFTKGSLCINIRGHMLSGKCASECVRLATIELNLNMVVAVSLVNCRTSVSSSNVSVMMAGVLSEPHALLAASTLAFWGNTNANWAWVEKSSRRLCEHDVVCSVTLAYN